jgi:hypothetical protein
MILRISNASSSSRLQVDDQQNELRWGQFCCWLYMLATRSASSINLDEGLVSTFVEKGFSGSNSFRDGYSTRESLPSLSRFVLEGCDDILNTIPESHAVEALRCCQRLTTSL